MTPQEILATPEVQEWLDYLEKNPDKQITKLLGFVDGKRGDFVRGCCLGAYFCLTVPNSLKLKITDTAEGMQITDQGNTTMLSTSYKELYLRTSNGSFSSSLDKEVAEKYFPAWKQEHVTGPASLTHANDNGATWPEIAKFTRENPEEVFLDHSQFQL